MSKATHRDFADEILEDTSDFFRDDYMRGDTTTDEDIDETLTKN